jgi:hypothetical protein
MPNHPNFTEGTGPTKSRPTARAAPKASAKVPPPNTAKKAKAGVHKKGGAVLKKGVPPRPATIKRPEQPPPAPEKNDGAVAAIRAFLRTVPTAAPRVPARQRRPATQRLSQGHLTVAAPALLHLALTPPAPVGPMVDFLPQDHLVLSHVLSPL